MHDDPGLLCTRMTTLLGSLGPVAGRLASGYSQSARKAYVQCGANNLVRMMGEPVETTESSQPMRHLQECAMVDCDSPRTTSSKSLVDDDISEGADGSISLRSKIGLESVLRTSLLLASEKDGEGLIKRVLSVLMQVRLGIRLDVPCI